jgi:hypothetical protein
MTIEVGPEIEVERLPSPLLSTSAASKLAKCAWRTFPALAASAGIEPLRVNRQLKWRRSDVVRMLGLDNEATQ